MDLKTPLSIELYTKLCKVYSIQVCAEIPSAQIAAVQVLFKGSKQPFASRKIPEMSQVWRLWAIIADCNSKAQDLALHC